MGSTHLYRRWKERNPGGWERRFEFECRSCGALPDAPCVSAKGITLINHPHVPRLNDIHQLIEKEKHDAHR